MDYPLEMTPPTLAKLAGVGENSIRAWITTGQLEAWNSATSESDRPRWHISREAWIKFRDRRLHQNALRRRLAAC